MLKDYRELKTKSKVEVIKPQVSEEEIIDGNITYGIYKDTTGELLHENTFNINTTNLDSMINNLTKEKQELQMRMNKIDYEIEDLQELKSDIEKLHNEVIITP